MADRLRYQTTYVQVPRRCAAAYWDRPWADVLAAGKAGKDGSVVTGRPRLWPDVANPADVPDVAYLTEGQFDWAGKTVLFQQNWTEK